METYRVERQYLGSEAAFALARSEPVAPAEYTNGVVRWLYGLGDLVDCPTCTGNGRTTCKTCKGQQKLPCPRCSHLDNHQPPCKKCNGTRVAGQAACEACHGRGYESPCLKCNDERAVACPTCIGLGSTTCEKCDGNAKVYQVDVAEKKYETTASVSWQKRPDLPQGVVDLLERELPLSREEALEKPESGVVEVLASRRLYHAGLVDVVRFKRLLSSTVVSCGGYVHRLDRRVGNALPAAWWHA